MDLRLTPDDRIGAGKKKRGKPAKKKPARARAKKVEPRLEGGPAARSPRRASALVAERRTNGGNSRKAKPQRGGKRSARGRKKRPLTLGRIIGKLFYWGFVLAVWAGIGLAGIVAYYAVQLPASNTWAIPERPANIRIVAADGRLISNRGQMGGEAVALRELPHYVPAAVIAIEDKRFMSHFGVDPLSIARVVIKNTIEGRIIGGGSTLTQQLAKNLFLTPDQTIGRKVQEAVLALWLERTYSKQDILELYLNRVYFGAGASGIEAAAQRYFGKSARNLSLGEAAILAGLLKSPARLSPDRHPEAAAARARTVLGVMAAEGFISRDEAKAAAIDPNKRIRTRVAGAEYYVADWVETLMQAYLGPVDEDVIVTTTIDWDLQKHGEFLIREMVANQGEDRNFSQGALVALDPDGAVRAIVGGTDYAQSQYNRAVTARRQPGSSFKPIVYLSALEHGFTPDTTVTDARFDYNGWSPENASGEYAGDIALRDALAYSLNTVAARLAIEVGPATIVDTARRLGISSPIEAVPSIALGTAEVSLLELTAAYAPFANGGNGTIAHVITRIQNTSGEVLYQDIPAGPGRVVLPGQVAQMNAMLENAVAVGTGKKAHLANWPIAGKTGTSQNNRDALFVGYSAAMITGVWLGNDDGAPMKRVGGGSLPVSIWSDFMARAHQGLAPANLPGAYQGAVLPPATVAGTQTDPAPPRKRTLSDLFSELFGD